jgi:Xaa-Pro aminopeptidase
MTDKTIKKRVTALAAKLKDNQLDGAIVTSMSNVTYLTGFMGHDAWALVLGKRVWLLTDSRYTEQAQSECFGCKIIQRKNTLAEEAAAILKRNKSAKKLAIEETATLLLFATIKKHIKLKFKTTSKLIETIRSIKSDDEIANIVKASKIADASFDAVIKQMHVGMTESDFAGMLDYEFRKRNSVAAFDSIVCFGSNGSRNHHFPGPRKLKKNDTVLVDFGACYKGYRSDKTRSFAVGKVSKAFRAAYDTVAKAQDVAIKLIADGTPLKDIDAAIRSVINATEFPAYEHGSGHGLGLDIHELPFLSRLSKGKLQAGQAITIEPGIYIPGKFGIRIEDDVLVTKTGYKILSRSNIKPELKIITPANK